MSLYQLPDIKIPRLKRPENLSKFWQGRCFYAVITIFISFIFGAAGGIFGGYYIWQQNTRYFGNIQNSLLNLASTTQEQYSLAAIREEAVVNVVKEASSAVVSIIISKNLPVYEQYYTNPFGDLLPDFQIPQIRQKGTELKEVGGGSGFIVSSDGLILTNKHVVSDGEAEYTVLTNDGKKYPAKVLALDSTQDLALIKIEETTGSLPVVKLGNSDDLQIGRTVITIGNALGELRNTVSLGVVSGLSRTITASGGGLSETIEDVIQTDAAINSGNSGGPLLNLSGEVVGINTAVASDAENIGFAIPINKAKKAIESVKNSGRIIYPFLGVRYILINDDIQQEEKLSVNYGAWLQKGEKGEPAVATGTAAQSAGLKERDIILEFNGEKITTDNSLADIIQEYNPGDRVSLKVLREGNEISLEAVLGERED